MIFLIEAPVPSGALSCAQDMRKHMQMQYLLEYILKVLAHPFLLSYIIAKMRETTQKGDDNMKRTKKKTRKQKIAMNPNGSGNSKFAKKSKLSKKGLNPRSPFSLR